jgi:hypothetical protein
MCGTLFVSSARILASFYSVLCHVLYVLIPTFLVCQDLMPLPHTLPHDTFNFIYEIIVFVFPLILHLPVSFFSISYSILVYMFSYVDIGMNNASSCQHIWYFCIIQQAHIFLQVTKIPSFRDFASISVQLLGYSSRAL